MLATGSPRSVVSRGAMWWAGMGNLAEMDSQGLLCACLVDTGLWTGVQHTGGDSW
jgi:hypothetical protein